MCVSTLIRMALMPQASYRPINYAGVPKMRSAGPNVLVFHTIVGHDPASAAHLSIGGYGELTQSRDTYYQSAACLDGNPRAVAVETEDIGAPFPPWDTNNGHDVPAWSDAQVERAVEICVWAHQVHHIPLVLAADSKTASAGVAYHRQGIDSDNNFAGYIYGGRVSGGEHWSTSKGKVCPGDRRIQQLIEVVIPRARVLAGLDVEAEDMAGQYSESLPASLLDVNGDLLVVSTIIGIDKGGAAGMNRVWISLMADNDAEGHGMFVSVAHWRVANGDGTTRIVPYFTESVTIPPLGYGQPPGPNYTEAPEGAIMLILNHVSPNGGAYVVAYR